MIPFCFRITAGITAVSAGLQIIEKFLVLMGLRMSISEIIALTRAPNVVILCSSAKPQAWRNRLEPNSVPHKMAIAEAAICGYRMAISGYSRRKL